MSYSFESPEAFLADFGVPATFGLLTAQVIFDQPDMEILGNRVISKEYKITFVTADLPGLVFDSQVIIGGNVYVVQFVMGLSDGVFSEARLQLGV